MLDAQGFFDALGDLNRRRILALLSARAELCVCDLIQLLQLAQPKVSRHLGVLRGAGLVSMRRTGTWAFYRLTPGLPAWASRILTEMAAGMAGEPLFCADAARLAALPASAPGCAAGMPSTRDMPGPGWLAL